MVMSWIWTGLVLLSIVCAMLTGRGSELSASVIQGARSGVTLSLSLTGSICLWTGAGRLMEKAGITAMLSRLLRPLLHTLFPSARENLSLANDLSANICANLLGLGNAATPMGISAAKQLKQPGSDLATDELCRLIVLNTASIQLIPTNVAAIRSTLGCSSPFDILGAVWVTSLTSAFAGVSAAWLMGKLWRG